MRHAANPTDSYRFQFYDVSNNNCDAYATSGYVGNYRLMSLPGGFSIGTLYRWSVDVLAPDSGIGIGHYYEDITVSAVNTRLFFLPLLGR